MTKTTLYIPRDLRQAAKKAAVNFGQTLNGFVIAAIEDRLAAGHVTAAGSTTPASLEIAAQTADGVDPHHDLRNSIRRIETRLAAVEQALGRAPPSSPPVPVPRRPLTVRQVRQVVREILVERGAPIPHRALLDILLHERGLVLPGKDVSENLRTVLVHPKAQGFTFTRAAGYWVDDRPMPPEDSPLKP